LSRQVQRQMREFFGDLVFDTVIHRTVRLAEAPSAGEPVLLYAPKSKATAEYQALAGEISNPGGKEVLTYSLPSEGTFEELSDGQT